MTYSVVYHNHDTTVIQNLKSNDQTILEIFDLKESSNLIDQGNFAKIQEQSLKVKLQTFL